MNRHIPQATIDEARDAIRGGRRLDDVAGQLGISSDQLTRLLGFPRLLVVPDGEPDLFAGTERLNAVL